MDLQELGIGTNQASDSCADRIEKTDAEKAIRQREYRKENHERIREIEKKSASKRVKANSAYRAQWRKNNPGRDNETRKLWREKNREKLREQYNEYYAKNQKRRLLQSKLSRERHKEEIRERVKLNHKNNKDLINAKHRAWCRANPEKLKAKAKKYLPRRMELSRLRRLNDPNQRIIDACRTRVRFILIEAGVKKIERTFELVGCTPDFFRQYIEAQFTKGMSWDNYGQWEIDHTIALSKFDMQDKEQRLRAFNYTNCRPLWQSENRAKCDNSIGPHQPLLI